MPGGGVALLHMSELLPPLRVRVEMGIEMKIAFTLHSLLCDEPSMTRVMMNSFIIILLRNTLFAHCWDSPLLCCLAVHDSLADPEERLGVEIVRKALQAFLHSHWS